MNTHATAVASERPASGQSAWRFSLPLLVGVLAYVFSLSQGKALLGDGDTYWHVAAGHWMFQYGAVPAHDPFSHTMRGGAWMAHEWLSEIVLAASHRAGGWTLVAAVTSMAFAATVALLARALLKWLEPIHVLAVATLAVLMTIGHLLARPHILAMPLMMIWLIELVHAREADRAPALWLLPIMTLWANMHGGFTLGIALALAFAVEALLGARRQQRLASVAKAWGIFLALAAASALLTPHGPQGIWFTWQVLVEGSFALQRIGEWRSPDFHKFQPLEFWLLGAMALAMYQGLRLPPIRLLLLLGLVHLSLKHIRNVELLGLLAPLFLAPSVAGQWQKARQNKEQFEIADRFLARLVAPAGPGAVLVSLALAVAVTLSISHARPIHPAESVSPALAVRAVQQAGMTGPVLNEYGWGGYLIYMGIPPFIDGRADMYGDNFLKEYAAAIELRSADSLPKLLAKYKIAWTLLPPDSAAVAMLDQHPQWRRLYADKTAVVHVKTSIEVPAQPAQAALRISSK